MFISLFLTKKKRETNVLKVDTWLNHSACLADTLFLRAYSEAPVIEADTALTCPCAWLTGLTAVLWQAPRWAV